MAGLWLEAREVTDLTRWRWVLTDASGAFVADHEVRLDPADWQFEAFADLPFYLRWHAAPDRRAADQGRIVGEIGEWIASRVLGPAVTDALVQRRPVTVRVVLPPAAAELAYRPLELAHANGRPIAVQNVTLVMEGGVGTPRIEPVGDRLRVLGLFSLPEGGRPLNLRRERAELVRLVREIAASGKAADIRVLQYGVTRDRLRDVLAEAEGWDIIHVSGHGRPGSLTLETAAGQPDRVSAAELAGLLDPARERLKLVAVSACWSAAVLADEQRRLLGLPARDHDQDDLADGERGDGSPSPPSGALASELAGRLGCAVLAMRYPVGDEFAIALSGKLYGLLAGKGQPLPRAVGMALRELSPPIGGSDIFPALSMGTLALFGGMAAELCLAAPSRSVPASHATARPKMAGFPPEPPRFIGRTAVLARSSAALAPRSGVPGVLLHGMPGGGKTSCALELAYGQEEAFDRLVWYKAPDPGMDITGALTDFALTLERYLPDFQLAYDLVSSERLGAVLPRLAELMESRRVLVVIDNAESLLAEGGGWRDDRWGQVLAALASQAGRGRVVVTSRQLPVPALPSVRVEAVNALSADEALLMARELPNLNALTLRQVPGLGAAVSRTLARNAIAMAQGHPKLLELAEGQAANPGRLLRLVKTGDQEWRKRGGVPEGFFATGEPSATGEDYLRVLTAWTMAVTSTLRPGGRDLFWFLGCLEEADRERSILDASWDDLWPQLGHRGRPPSLDRALAAIAALGLITVRDGAGDSSLSYAIHPGVAEGARAHAGPAFRDAVDARAAAYWTAVYRHASGEDGQVDTGRLVRAGLAAVPYLLRQQQWDRAFAMLQGAFIRNPSRASAALVLPAIEQITRLKPARAGLLARVQRVLDPARAETQMRAYLTDAAARGNHQAASVTAGRLASLYRDSGRLAEALALTEQKADHTRQAGLGPWTQLLDQVRRLGILIVMGHASQVLDEVQRLREHMVTLPAVRGPNETTPPWSVREELLSVGRDAARLLGRLDDALALNAEVVASRRNRRATTTSIIRARFCDYEPLLRLNRIQDALALLLECRQVFEEANDIRWLGIVLGALAETESLRGHGEAAVSLQRGALRYLYLDGDVAGIAAGYRNLGNFLGRHRRQAAAAVASHLAAALIDFLIKNEDGAAGSLRAAAGDLRALGIAPPSIAELERQIGDISGTDLPGLIARITPEPETGDEALRIVVARAMATAAQPPSASVEAGG